jgi:hypothetical protein
MTDSLQAQQPVASAPPDTAFRFSDTGALREMAPVRIQPLFGRHELEMRHEMPVPVSRPQPDWMFPVLLGVLAMITFLKIFYSRYFKRLFAAFVNLNLANQLVRDENVLIQRASVLMNVVFYLVAALFLYFLGNWRHWELDGLEFGFSRFIFFAVLVAAVYALKLLILKSCGTVFGIDREMSAYIFNIFLVNSVLGILLLPVIVLLAFATWIPADWLIRLALAIVLLSFLYRLVRGVLIGRASPAFSPFYLILYLCTLELAPLLVVVKLASAR